MEAGISITFTHAEALVLSDCFHRFAQAHDFVLSYNAEFVAAP
jgi:hypothetical protein